MSQFLALQRLGLLRMKNWFRNYSGTKLFIIFGFLAILFILVVFEFLLADAYFRYAAIQKDFGRAVSEYSINAALLVLFLLSFVSSFSSSSNLLYKSDFLRFLHSTPVSQGKLFISRLITSLVSSAGMVVVFISPILLAFGINFYEGFDFILRSLVSLVLLTISSHSLGSSAAVLLVNYFGKVSRKFMFLIFIIFISGSFMLMRFLFPPSFFRLYYAADWLSFQKQLGQLPLLSSYLPTNWLASTITHNWSLATLVASGFSLGTVGVALLIGEKLYRSSWRKVQEGQFMAGSSTSQLKVKSNFPRLTSSASTPVITNDLLFVIRSSSELSYLAFLSGLVFALLYLVRNIPALSDVKPEFVPVVQTLSLIGFSYLFMTLSARLVYPLLAREKKTSWLLFSLPITRENILNAKILFTLILTIPAVLIGFIAGIFAELQTASLLAYTLILTITVIVVALIQLFSGTIAPNFMESDNLEAASTSGSGLAAIFLSLIFISISGISFYKVITGSLSARSIIFILFACAFLMLFPLFNSARNHIKRYNL